MMNEEIYFRTEDIRLEDILDLYVPTSRDAEIIEALKAAQPVILEGSRGTGKSFLLRVAEAQLTRSFAKDKIVPVYVIFRKSPLLQTSDQFQFHHWMVARFCAELMASLRRMGMFTGSFLGQSESLHSETSNLFSTIAQAYENSFRQPGATVDITGLPSIDDLRTSTEELCRIMGIRRIIAFFDEAAHNFRPDQQRQFFTLFRELRSPYISCKAAIYPGVTSFGETFQPAHDATWLSVNRNILDTDYIKNMRQIVEKQAPSEIISAISRQGENFAVLAYAASGNPRLLLKNVSEAPKMTSQNLNNLIREFYRQSIWSEHSNLAELYTGYRPLIDWGRQFIEKNVLPAMSKHNAARESRSRIETTCFFWIHRDSPELVKHALRLLAYIGIVVKEADGIRNNKSEIGSRYSVNLGCLFALNSNPLTEAFEVAKHLTTRRFTEFGENAPEYSDLIELVEDLPQPDLTNIVLGKQLSKTLNVLDITEWQKNKLLEGGYLTVGDVLDATEEELQQLRQVGEKRSRRILNAAVASVLEYLSG